jgi:IS5 family transposase
VIAIRLQSRRDADRPALVRSDRRLMGTTRAVLREAATMVRRLGQAIPRVDDATGRRLHRVQQRLQHWRPLITRVLHQTHARVIGGDTHVPDKVLRLFEPHTEAIRKGKAAKPTEFGKLVTIQESEHPDLATADRGFSSAANEATATARGVRRVALPHAGHKAPARRGHEKQRWFRRAACWRVGSEGRISVLKHRHGLHRSRYRGAAGTARWVGLGVIANNLRTTADFLLAQATA